MLIQKSKNTYMFLNRIMKIQMEIYEEINIYVCTEIKKNRIVEIKKKKHLNGRVLLFILFGEAFRIPTGWMLLVTTRGLA